MSDNGTTTNANNGNGNGNGNSTQEDDYYDDDYLTTNLLDAEHGHGQNDFQQQQQQQPLPPLQLFRTRLLHRIRPLGEYVGTCTLCIMTVAIPLVTYHKLSKKRVDKAAFDSAGVMVVGTLILSLRLVYLHLTHWYMPDVQKYVVRILWMVPLYAIQSWLSLRFHTARLYIDSVRDLYEAYVIQSFVYYLMELLGGQDALAETLRHKPASEGLHTFPLNLVLEPWELGMDFMLQCKHGVLQYVVMKTLATLIIAILEPLGLYGEGEFDSWFKAYPYISFGMNVSVMYALYCLVKLFHATNYDLRHPIDWHPMGKFLCVKGVVFFTWWQGVLIFYLKSQNIISDIGSWNAGDIANGLQDYCICLEMVFFAIAHSFTFTHTEYLPGRYQEAQQQHQHQHPQSSQDPPPTTTTTSSSMEEQPSSSQHSQSQSQPQSLQSGEPSSEEQHHHDTTTANNGHRPFAIHTTNPTASNNKKGKQRQSQHHHHHHHHQQQQQRSSDPSSEDTTTNTTNHYDHHGGQGGEGGGGAAGSSSTSSAAAAVAYIPPPPQPPTIRTLPRPMGFRDAFWSSTLPKETLSDIKRLRKGVSPAKHQATSPGSISLQDISSSSSSSSNSHSSSSSSSSHSSSHSSPPPRASPPPPPRDTVTNHPQPIIESSTTTITTSTNNTTLSSSLTTPMTTIRQEEEEEDIIPTTTNNTNNVFSSTNNDKDNNDKDDNDKDHHDIA
eukprot:CAMPEP_0195284920 /NCGR_PEP_ID=MMETSP0707-20130614/2942_1 /TAXON_ID=33640 /ORGANISM="Asterionellopsis glacialis, Strain CCMP134" /LENGTH=720 /DNA_ID=CAMNT_0040344329 /DNA_START=20 /DNA_END=2182 /DNA_ORIENTATION=+